VWSEMSNFHYALDDAGFDAFVDGWDTGFDQISRKILHPVRPELSDKRILGREKEHQASHLQANNHHSITSGNDDLYTLSTWGI
jgi:hypothetical protein